MSSKVLYEVDPHNRLVIRRSGRGSNLKKFRRVVSGRFRTDSKNRLYYEVFKSSGRDVPQKIKFSGDYSFDKRHNLIYSLDKWSNQCEGNRLRLKTRLIDAGKNEIMFLVQSRDASIDKRHIYTVKLHGAWQVDKNNRLSFGVKQKRDKVDTLTFFKAWKINKNNEIIYASGRNSEIVTLKGDWEIRSRCRVGYVLDKKIKSGFVFKTSLGQIIPRRKGPYVKFDITVVLSKKKRLKRNVVFGCRCRTVRGRKVILEAVPCRNQLRFKLTKDILDRRGIGCIESRLGEKERYIGGGVVLRW